MTLGSKRGELDLLGRDRDGEGELAIGEVPAASAICCQAFGDSPAGGIVELEVPEVRVVKASAQDGGILVLDRIGQLREIKLGLDGFESELQSIE